MKAKNLNRSSEKTKKAIKLAFAEILQKKKDFNKISVSELVEKANINRGTFYLHYDSIYGVAEEFEEEILNSLFIDTENTISLNTINNYFDDIFKYLKNNEEIYKMLLVSDAPQVFLKRLNKLMNNTLLEILSNNSNVKKSKSLVFDVSFFTDGVINQVLKYFRNEYNYTLDDINKYTKKYFKILFL